ncbi:Zinc/cadmium resistance protein [Orchesella cincta]|uniref:Zinc/cadmium resistance protein n=1 Tax=Orchesella cincta TaxID=48709 RepID=A0A1D2N7Y6_ORCCI|nr:Zinc/cadmium resistance protein [Orchesella cincta]
MAEKNWTPGTKAKNRKHTKSEIRLLFMLFFTFSYFLVELIVGYATNSMALVADSFHMLSDVVALLIAFISIKLSKRKWSKNTFGLARAEVLGALVNAVFLYALCFSIVLESIQRFVEPKKIEKPDLVLYVGGFGLLVNLIGLCMFHNHGHIHGHSHGKPKTQTDDTKKNDSVNISEQVRNNIIATQTNSVKLVEWSVNKDPIVLSPRNILQSQNQETEVHQGVTEPAPVNNASHSASQMNIHGVFLHIVADALGSVVVIISASVIWLTDWEYNDYIDPLLSVILVLLISYSTWPLFVDSSMILLQTVPKHIDVNSLKEKVLQEFNRPISLHNLNVWQLTGSKFVATVHVICNSSMEDSNDTVEKITRVFRNEGIESSTIQLEVASANHQAGADTGNACLLDSPAETSGSHEHGHSAAAESQSHSHIHGSCCNGEVSQHVSV